MRSCRSADSKTVLSGPPPHLYVLRSSSKRMSAMISFGSDIHVRLVKRFHVTVGQNSYSWNGGQQQTMVIREVCPRCKSSRYKKNGHIHNGKQNHHCHDCGRQFVQCFEQYLSRMKGVRSSNACLWNGFPCAAFVARWVSNSSGYWVFSSSA